MPSFDPSGDRIFHPPHFHQLTNLVDELKEILVSVRTDCDPAAFFSRIRVWFPGRKLVYDLEDRESVEEEWMGSSAAQSTTTQALDVFLDIEPPTNHRKNTTGVRMSKLQTELEGEPEDCYRVLVWVILSDRLSPFCKLWYPFR